MKDSIKKGNYATIEDVENLLKKRSYVKTKRRTYRKRNELPHPELPADHELNRAPRLTKQFASRIDPELSDKVNNFIDKENVSKRDVIEEALRDYLAKHDKN